MDLIGKVKIYPGDKYWELNLHTATISQVNIIGGRIEVKKDHLYVKSNGKKSAEKKFIKILQNGIKDKN